MKNEKLNVSIISIIETSRGSLDLSSLDLDQIPKCVMKNNTIKDLNLSRNPRFKFNSSYGIGFSASVRRLDISNTGIKIIPVLVFNCNKNITWLNCNDTPLTHLPKTITHLKELSEIHLDRTNIRSVDDLKLLLELGNLQFVSILQVPIFESEFNAFYNANKTQIERQGIVFEFSSSLF